MSRRSLDEPGEEGDEVCSWDWGIKFPQGLVSRGDNRLQQKQAKRQLASSGCMLATLNHRIQVCDQNSQCFRILKYSSSINTCFLTNSLEMHTRPAPSFLGRELSRRELFAAKKTSWIPKHPGLLTVSQSLQGHVSWPKKENSFIV